MEEYIENPQFFRKIGAVTRCILTTFKHNANVSIPSLRAWLCTEKFLFFSLKQEWSISIKILGKKIDNIFQVAPLYFLF